MQRRRLSSLTVGLSILLIACTNGASVTTAVPATSQTPIPTQSASAIAGSPPGARSSTPSTPVASVPAIARTITESDNGATVTVAVGAVIVLALRTPAGSDPWQIHPPDPSILAPVALPGATAAQAVTMQGYRAVGMGRTAITAESRPHCDPGKACAQVIQGFRVTVVVTV